MKQYKWLSSLVIICIALVALTACGGSSGPSATVSLTTYKIAITPASIAAGTITFHVTNTANDVSHDLIVVKTDLAAGSLPVDSTGLVDLTKVTALGQITSLAPGATQDLVINNMTSGHYVFFCNLAGHYASGMYTDFTIN
jgi:uncharacterized cupredoxin-like copper-binding protein